MDILKDLEDQRGVLDGARVTILNTEPTFNPAIISHVLKDLQEQDLISREEFKNTQ